MATFDIYSTLQNDISVDEENKTIQIIPQLDKKDYAKLKILLGRMGAKWVSSKGQFHLTKSPSGLRACAVCGFTLFKQVSLLPYSREHIC